MNVVPQLQALFTHKNYLYRISAMLCAGTLAELGGGPLLDKHLVPMVMKMSSDPVPNVRFNAAKTIQAIHGTCKTVNTVSIQETSFHVSSACWRMRIPM